MFQKVKDIKRKIYLAKIAGAIFVVVFVLMLGMTIFQQFQIMDLKNQIQTLNSVVTTQ